VHATAASDRGSGGLYFFPSLTMAIEQPKKITGGAFGRFLSEKRGELMKELSGKPASAVVKLASERFKALPEAGRAEYEEKYSQAVEQYNKDLEAFKAAGGEMKAIAKRKGQKGEDGAAKKAKKDPDAPKKPAGGAFGRFLAKHRAEFQEQTKGQPITAIAKLASEKWKQVSEEERGHFQAEFVSAMEAYKAAMKDYVPPEPKVDEKKAAKQAKEEAKEAERSAKAEEKRAKREAKEADKASKDDARRAKKEAKQAEKTKAGGKGQGATAKAKARARMPLRKSKARQPAAPTVELQAGVAAKADKEGLADKLRQLASRQDIIDSKKTQTAMLKALQESGGLIHPAKRALLGA